MKVFVIHRFKYKTIAKNNLAILAEEASLKLKFHFLHSARDSKWKQKAKKAILSSEAVIVYDTAKCNESPNAKWEIAFAKSENKHIIEINDYENDLSRIKQELVALYTFEEEFENCFIDNSYSLDLYKLMLDSSEKLIQRRQITNTFFITIIGVLISIAGFLFQTQAIENNTVFILYGFAAIGLLLCKSWHNLIDNYGKLNKAKFDVILRLEKQLGTMIYSAEWIALGKGLRPQKYKSFTSTEMHVPIYFSILIAALTVTLTIWHIVSRLCL